MIHVLRYRCASNTISTSNRIETRIVSQASEVSGLLQIPYPPQIGLKRHKPEFLLSIVILQIPYPPQIGLKQTGLESKILPICLQIPYPPQIGLKLNNIDINIFPCSTSNTISTSNRIETYTCRSHVIECCTSNTISTSNRIETGCERCVRRIFLSSIPYPPQIGLKHKKVGVKIYFFTQVFWFFKASNSDCKSPPLSGRRRNGKLTYYA